MLRIMIIGCGGAGKSTLSRKLHQITQIPLIHLDQHFWKPNWVETDKGLWAEKVNLLSNQASWIIDGNYGGTMDIRFKNADTILFLDRSTWLCLYRVLKRVVLNFGTTRPDMQEGCKERFSWDFLKYVYHYNTAKRPGILEKLKEYQSTKKVIILRSDKAVNAFLKEQKLQYKGMH